MTNKPILTVLGLISFASLSACASNAEIAARQQIDEACIAGNLQACAVVQQRVDAENQALATSFPSKY